MPTQISEIFIEIRNKCYKQFILNHKRKPTAPELEEKVEQSLYVYNPLLEPGIRVKGKWNQRRSYEKWVSKAPSVEKVLEEQENELNRRWDIMESVKWDLRSLKLIREVYQYCAVIDEALTVHQAIWLDRLSDLLDGSHEYDGLIIFPEQALAIINQYIRREKNNESTKDLDDWLFVNASNKRRNPRLEAVMQSHRSIPPIIRGKKESIDKSGEVGFEKIDSYLFTSELQTVAWADGVEGLPPTTEVRSRMILVRRGQDELSRSIRQHLSKEQVDQVHRFDKVYGGDPIYANLDRRKALLATYVINQLAKGKNWKSVMLPKEKYEAVIKVIQWVNSAGEGSSEVPKQLLNQCGVTEFNNA